MESEVNVEAAVKDILCRILDVDVGTLHPTAHLVDDLGADSLAVVEIILSAEERFNIVIPDEIDQDRQVATVGGCVRYIEQRLAAKGGGET
jgi:acyl carrier protein